MALVRWKFTDPVTLEVGTFAINPNDGGTASFSKQIAVKNTSAPDGQALLFEGRQQVQQPEFKGDILTESDYDMLLYWFNKRHQVYMTDDLNRTTSIYITDLTLNRVRAVQYPWKHTYTVKYVVLDWQ